MSLKIIKRKVKLFHNITYFNVLGLNFLAKLILNISKSYLKNPKSCLNELKKYWEKYNFDNQYLPSLTQIRNFSYQKKKADIIDAFPQIQKGLKEFLNRFDKNLIIEKNEMIVLYQNLEIEEFLIVVSSKLCLENAIMQSKHCKQSFICLDGTYKLLMNGYVTMVMGTENNDHSFRLIALAISFSENTNNYKEFLNVVHKYLAESNNFTLNPHYIMSDLAECIHNAIKDNYPKSKHLYCQFHLMKNIQKISSKKEFNEKKKYVFFGIKALKECENQENFNNLWNLVKEFWIDCDLDIQFINSFENEYIKNDIHWYNGACEPPKSKTNNSLEGFKNRLKIFFNREKQPVKVFFSKLSEFFKGSQFYNIYQLIIFKELDNDDDKSFESKCNIKDKVWKKAIDLSYNLENIEYVVYNRPQYHFFLRKNRDEDKALINLKLHFTLKNPQNMDEYFIKHFYFHKYDDINDICNCSKFSKRSYCKHQLAIKLSKKIISNPFEDPIYKERSKPGRKKKVSTALNKS